MIISHRKNYIFLHSRKTAGSSISVALAKNFGDDDVMLGCWPDAMKYGIYPNRACRSLAAKGARLGRLDPALYLSGSLFPDRFNAAIKKYFRYTHGFDAGPHSSAAVVKAYADSFWDDAFKFAFVRNPWDHAVSDYFWRGGHRKGVAFKEFLKLLRDVSAPDPQRVRPPLRSNWSVYAIDDEIVVDYVAKYENLEADVARVSKQIGERINISSVYAKGNVRVAKNTATYYDEECVELVRDIYRKEIDAFCYEVPF
ncbi:sulfotransferase family 2 domain-containing protein [Roseibacterium sp. SDUM158017]|uniref:sulfotransferase family 2 domain-containing protein n=1 Tax=Roseicyclus salinarum TaxID=3036773 RepID=UPI00241528E6|nr:sulfotransferase family 2 domain-containing protein [Roseibacterium sp. SDUM158017]MDG4649628.1 sulfotransferase family 2 domain-containing protein [Roseibacterium sp. SDUM158017]